ncbi:MAG: hypothetical protein FD128_2515, partial [Hyphomonadaceae bacterium]
IYLIVFRLICFIQSKPWKNIMRKFNKLNNSTVVINTDRTDDTVMNFSNGIRITADYWRIIKDGKHLLRSFDHEQQYGLPAPINANSVLHSELKDQHVKKAKLDSRTGDIVIWFRGNLILQILNFTSYEVWEVTFTDGSREFSNYNR